MIILPIWAWLLLGAIVVIVGLVMRVKKALVDDPRSRQALASGTAVHSGLLESTCKAAIEGRDRKSGHVSPVAFLDVLEYSRGDTRARTPISVGMSEQTLGVVYKSSATQTTTHTVRRSSITAGHPGTGGGKLTFTIEIEGNQHMTFQLQSVIDQGRLAGWVHAGLQAAGQ